MRLMPRILLAEGLFESLDLVGHLGRGPAWRRVLTGEPQTDEGRTSAGQQARQSLSELGCLFEAVGASIAGGQRKLARVEFAGGRHRLVTGRLMRDVVEHEGVKIGRR